jgi:hypothetical protein
MEKTFCGRNVEILITPKTIDLETLVMFGELHKAEGPAFRKGDPCDSEIVCRKGLEGYHFMDGKFGFYDNTGLRYLITPDGRWNYETYSREAPLHQFTVYLVKGRRVLETISSPVFKVDSKYKRKGSSAVTSSDSTMPSTQDLILQSLTSSSDSFFQIANFGDGVPLQYVSTYQESQLNYEPRRMERETPSHKNPRLALEERDDEFHLRTPTFATVPHNQLLFPNMTTNQYTYETMGTTNGQGQPPVNMVLQQTYGVETNRQEQPFTDKYLQDCYTDDSSGEVRERKQ